MNDMTLVCAAFVLIDCYPMYSQKPKKQKAPAGSVTWDINNLDKIGGHQTTVIGNPIPTNVPDGKAVLFNGVNDRLLVNSNPLSRAPTFTTAALFRPPPA